MSMAAVSNNLPELVVFDLDMCLWSPEMYTLDHIPTASDKVIGRLGSSGEGTIAVCSGYEKIRLFPAALKILQDVHVGKYGNMRIAAASSADTPLAASIGRAAMSLLEVVPGVTVREVFARGWPDGFGGNLQIGRTPPLSADKAATHFPLLRAETGISYDKMLFFDDCNWGDHCANVERLCPGVVTQRTPRGLQEREWQLALAAYARKHGQTPQPVDDNDRLN
jgi:magnesium-dependent phosphatase 1